MNPQERSLVNLYSEANFLALSILENLLANNCFVNVVTNDVNTWIKYTTNIAAKNKFSINSYLTFPKNAGGGYAIFCSGFVNKDTLSKDFSRFLDTVDLTKKKTFVVVPKEVFGFVDFQKMEFGDNAGIIYVGDLLGPRIDLNSNLKATNALKEILSRRTLTFPVGEVLYPMFVADAARQIVKWLFAFGPFGKETLLLGADTSVNYFWQTNVKLVGNIKYISDQNSLAGKLPRVPNIFRLTRDLNFMLTETYKWIRSNSFSIQEPKREIIKKVTPTKIQTPKVRKKWGRFPKYFWLTILIIFLFPIIDGILTAGLTYFSYRQFKSGNEKTALNLLYLGKSIALPSYYESGVFKSVPFFGQIYKETEYLSFGIIKASNIASDVISVTETGKQLVGLVLGDTPYSIDQTLQGTGDKLQAIYSGISAFEKESVQKRDQGSILAKVLLSKFNLSAYKQLVSQLLVMSNQLPEILGNDSSRTYLILFENNMELRPTGGFIGSYGLLTFDEGRLSDFTISDVYSADGQLNGHVEPPSPIKKYLGEANWWLRDSNWDPDFPTSAKRAEWFLDKEMDKTVDGVVSIDLFPVKDFLKISGPIYLQDYNMQITSDNLYEKVQSEVQDNFFPGTYKKASFLTALSRSILGKLNSLSSRENSQVLELLYKGLNERHVQVFLHDGDFQRAMSNLGWDGSVFVPTCSGNCYSDLVGVVEANVGVNKSNYFVKRSADVAVSIDGKNIQKTLTLTLQNSANPSLGVSGRYKSYIRLLVPQGASGINTMENFGQNTQKLSPDITDAKGRMEIGIITEVLAGESKKVVFSWENTANTPIDQYSLYFRKQAGVDNFPVKITIRSATRILSSNPAFTLTDQGSYLYNTTLVRDLFAKLSF